MLVDNLPDTAFSLQEWCAELQNSASKANRWLAAMRQHTRCFYATSRTCLKLC